jgi:hypothetical protein
MDSEDSNETQEGSLEKKKGKGSIFAALRSLFASERSRSGDGRYDHVVTPKSSSSSHRSCKAFF